MIITIIVDFSLINASELLGNNLLPVATSSGLSPSLLRKMGNPSLTGGGTMPKMSMSLLRESGNRYLLHID